LLLLLLLLLLLVQGLSNLVVLVPLFCFCCFVPTESQISTFVWHIRSYWNNFQEVSGGHCRRRVSSWWQFIRTV